MAFRLLVLLTGVAAYHRESGSARANQSQLRSQGHENRQLFDPPGVPGPFQGVSVGDYSAALGHEQIYTRGVKPHFGGGPRPCLNPIPPVLEAEDVTRKVPVSKVWCQKHFSRFDRDGGGSLDHDELMDLVGTDMYYSASDCKELPGTFSVGEFFEGLMASRGQRPLSIDEFCQAANYVYSGNPTLEGFLPGPLP